MCACMYNFWYLLVTIFRDKMICICVNSKIKKSDNIDDLNHSFVYFLSQMPKNLCMCV